MSKLTLDDAIKHCNEVAEHNENLVNWGCNTESTTNDSAEHRQLADWLTELKELREKYREVVMEGEKLNADYTEQVALNEQHKNREEQYKRLLKSAVEDFRFLESHSEDEEGSCLINYQGVKVDCKICPLNNNGKCDPKIGCRWNYEAEALKLIGEEGGNDEKNI